MQRDNGEVSFLRNGSDWFCSSKRKRTKEKGLEIAYIGNSLLEFINLI